MRTRFSRAVISITAATLSLGFAAAEPVETVIHNFRNSPDGSLPNSGVLVRGGLVYGVSPDGALADKYTGSGLVFELSPPGAGQKYWTDKNIHSFGANPGGVTPVGQLVADSSGALYGVTVTGGLASCLCGLVYKLIPPASAGKPWTRATVHAFAGGLDGSMPQAGLVMGAGGELYGTTYFGGYDGAGVVFRLTPPAKGKTLWTKATLFQFSGEGSGRTADGSPRGRLLVKDGIIYGTTTGGPIFSSGTVFKLTPPAKGKTVWTETVLAAFQDDKNGGDPEGGLVMDTSGALYGMTMLGGEAACPLNGVARQGCGIVFKLTPPAKGTAWKETIIHRFSGGVDGSNPLGNLVADARGALYATTSNGGGHGCTISGVVYGCGTIFKLTPSNAEKTTWTETILYRFPEMTTSGHLYYPQGIEPLDGLAADSRGNLFGTTNIGGTDGVGVVFELAGSGYAVH
jgi:uncharacterized repeat protein (TIGR03803 family)